MFLSSNFQYDLPLVSNEKKKQIVLYKNANQFSHSEFSYKVIKWRYNGYIHIGGR